MIHVLFENTAAEASIAIFLISTFRPCTNGLPSLWPHLVESMELTSFSFALGDEAGEYLEFFDVGQDCANLVLQPAGPLVPPPLATVERSLPITHLWCEGTANHLYHQQYLHHSCDVTSSPLQPARARLGFS
jgi:hypothetical protein